MRFRTWPVAALGLIGLLLLILVSILAASRKAHDIYTQLEQLNAHHQEVETKLRRLRSDVHLSGIFVRDYLLDQERSRAPEYRDRLTEYRRTNLATLGELRALAVGAGRDDHRIARLEVQLDQYWQALDPLFDWTPAEKKFLSARFLRSEVLPRREAALALAQEIEELNNSNLAARRAEVQRHQATFRSDLHTLLWQSLLLGAAVAIVVVLRLRVLERRSGEQHALAEDAEKQMRQLSQRLVAAQEEERKKLSRELHDHVGQMLTALRMEVGRIDRLRGPSQPGLAEAVVECRSLVDAVVRTVRDLALGLRPSMLDDFGLQPALEWHVRDFSRRYEIPVDLVVKGNLDELPDPHRTCVYRVVQEALTNCVRHSHATRIVLNVSGTPELLTITLSDDGVGLDAAKKRSGLGLRGIEERVRELGGSLSIRSAAGQGTTLIALLPVPARSEGPLARAAG
jgi:signal transduction histidine kinase